MSNYIEQLGFKASQCKMRLANATTLEKNAALMEIARALREDKEAILAENQKDLENGRANGLSSAMLERLMLNDARIESMAAACEHLCILEDPVGAVDSGHLSPKGMRILKTRVPLGVIGIIFESRPNVTIDAGALCLKSGNCCILRGGKEAIHTNIVLSVSMRKALKAAGLPEDCIQLVEDTDREIAAQMMRCNQYVDVLIPRGGARLIQAVVRQATVPVIETGAGNCHVYVDASAKIPMAVEIVDNGKTQRPSVCNAIETVLVHKDIAEAFLPRMKERLDEHHVELRGDETTKAILGDCVVPATEEDWATEYGDYILAVKVVGSLDEAIAHIAAYSTGHSECIVTESIAAGDKFQRSIDAAAVYVNCSTRFTDGEEFGLGAEIGISTQRLHTRGPMGLKELTTIKYLINGSGQIRG